MSADTSELQKALQYEREARQHAERERDALKQEHDEDQGVIRVWRGRCERAEQERDEARGDAEARKRVLAAERVGYQQVLDERDRAVADNARERDAHAMTATGWEKEALEWREKRAALLEYVRALEAVLPLAMHDEACQSDVSGTRDPSNCALCAANALKVTP